MTIPDLKQARLLKKHSKDVKGGGYITYTRVYDIGRLSLSDASLEPLDGLPEDSTIIISDSRIGKVPGEADERAIVTARGGDYYQAVQTRSGTATSEGTTITADTAIFYPSLVGQTITFNAPATYVVATYVSPTEITVTLTAGNQAAEDISFPEGSRLLTEASTDEFQWTRAGWWTVVRRWLCETEDREAEMIYLKTQTFTFDAADNSVVGRASGGSSRGRSPTYPHKAVIVMNYEAPIYDV